MFKVYLATTLVPKGPEIEKNQDLPLGLKFSSEIEHLKPHCLAAIFDSRLPSPELSPKMLPKMSLAHARGL